ncbi:hypothetical protein AGMMS50212_14420 [Spirochaetia bacterium]|nr:hypothetical protein AGMMS50212_14420 [Spirochaetia bacterium]
MSKLAKMNSGREINRVLLKDAIPLPVPFSVQVSVSDICNFACKYCKNSIESKRVKGTKGLLSWEKFQIIVDQFKQLCQQKQKKLKVFQFSGVGENLMHPKIIDMILLVKNSGISERIELLTNGARLSNEMSKTLIDAGLTRILISLQGISAEDYKENCDIDIDFEKFIDEIRFFHDYGSKENKCSVYLKGIDTAFPNKEAEKKFYDIYSPVCDTINIENAYRLFCDVPMDNVSGNHRYGYDVINKKCCDTIFTCAYLELNGDLSACSATPRLFWGNVFETPITELWYGAEHKKIMKTHLQGLRETYPQCKDCQSILYQNMPADNVDQYMDELLKRI